MKNKYKCLYEITGRIEDVATFLVPISDLPKEPEHEPVGEAYLCDICQTPFDGAYECPSCGHNEATKEPVYTTPPQPKEPEQEPDVYIPADALRQLKGTSLLILRSVPLYGYRGDGLTPLYTTPPQRKPLTDEQFISMVDSDGIQIDPELAFVIKEMVERAHDIKEQP